MPFKSEKQRKWMHATKPEMAKKWEKEKESVKEEDNKAALMKLYTTAMKMMPSSPKQKAVIKKIAALRKKLGMNEAMSDAEIKKMHKKYKETGELPPHLKKMAKDLDKFKVKHKVKNIVVPGLEWMSKIKESLEETERDYKDEYKKFQSSDKSKKYRAELNKYNRKKGTYGNGDGKDASHKNGKIAGFEKESTNRGRAEKSRLKKEETTRQEIEEYVDGILDGMGEEHMVNERKYHHKKLGDNYLGGYNSSKGDTEMFGDGKGRFYIWVKPKGKKAKYIDLPKRVKNRSDADSFHDRIKKTMGESVEEGFGGDLKGSDKKKFEKGRKENGEQLGYTLTGKSEVRESDLGLTYKKGKTVKVTHKKSGKEIVIIDKPNVRKEYEKIGFVAEGSCGYGIDGQLGNEPAGPHLLKKKKKKKDEASLGSFFSKNIGKHGGTRNKAEVEKIIKYLIKKGDTKNTALDKIKQNYDYVSKKYRTASVSKKAQILTSLEGKKKIQLKGRGVYQKYESVDEGEKRQSSEITAKFDKAYLNFAREVRDVISRMDRSTGDKTDGKIINKAYTKHLLPLDKLMQSWNKTQQKNPHIDESVNEAIEPSGIMAKINKIVQDKQHAKIGGVLVDMFSAGIMMQIYNAVNDKSKEQMNKGNIRQVQVILHKVMKQNKVRK